jgi:hypothetical protein
MATAFGEIDVRRFSHFESEQDALTRSADVIELRCFCCDAWVSSWPQTDLARCPLDGRYRGVSGRNADIAEVKRLTHFGPQGASLLASGPPGFDLIAIGQPELGL